MILVNLIIKENEFGFITKKNDFSFIIIIKKKSSQYSLKNVSTYIKKRVQLRKKQKKMISNFILFTSLMIEYIYIYI